MRSVRRYTFHASAAASTSGLRRFGATKMDVGFRNTRPASIPPRYGRGDCSLGGSTEPTLPNFRRYTGIGDASV
eukprot:1423094-Prymnesium_polylepis.2